uniref:interleukin-9 receptor-like n=1 Tax=Podarcis muralis TaxID=64176 RepID=UPI00109F99F9|nr:interleukin-9 receptor-like [Podarcis muralis]
MVGGKGPCVVQLLGTVCLPPAFSLPSTSLSELFPALDILVSPAEFSLSSSSSSSLEDVPGAHTYTLCCFWVGGGLLGFQQQLLSALHLVPVKCEPPFDLQSNMSSSKCWMQWRRPEAYEDIFLDDWQWELAFKTTEAPWEQAQNKVWVNKETWVEIEGFEFESGVEYVARIRCKTPDVNMHYRSQWSPWSTTTKWKAPPGNGRQQHRESHLLKHVFNLLFLCLGILLLLLLVLTIFWRSKGHCSANIPSPAAYFQPLYLSHSGDFKVTTMISGSATLNLMMAKYQAGEGGV